MEEAKIPVFSVLKKGTTLKNIFLNSPPPETGIPLSPSRENDPILMGRHPECHIVVDHPSISRFHLEVRPKSSSQKLFVTDRSSVHGTWVSGKKIQPNIPVELIEGDTIRLGASMRIYCLHWMPLSHAFEMEKPMSPLMEEASDFVNNDEALLGESFNEAWVSNIIPSAPPLRISSPGKLFSQDLEKKGEILIRKETFEQSSCFSSIVPLLESVSYSWPLKEEIGVSKNLLANEMHPEREELSPLRSNKIIKSSSLLLRRNKSIGFLQIENKSKENDSQINMGKENLKIKDQMAGAFAGGNEEEIPFVLLAEGNVKEEEEEFSLSDKENLTPVNSIGYMELKSNRKIERSPLSSCSLFLKEDLEIQERKVGDLIKGNGEDIPSVFLAEGYVKEEEEVTFFSDKKKMNLVNSISSKVLKNNGKIETSPLSSFSLFHKEDLEIAEQNLGALIEGNGEEIPSIFLAEGDLKEEEEEMCVSDEEKMTSVNSIGSKVLKRNREMNRSLLSSFNISNEDDLEIEQKIETFAIENGVEKTPSVFLGEGHVKEEEEAFVSDKEKLTLVNSSVSKVLRSNRGNETSPLSSLSTFDPEEERFTSDKPTSETTDQFKSNKLRSRSRLTKENGDSKLSDSKNLESLFSPEIKLQRNLFKPERSPLGEKTALNVEEDRFLSDKENWTPKVPKSSKSGKAFARDDLKAESQKDETFASDKDNLTPQSSMSITSKKALSQNHGKMEGETMRRGKERIPFQPLFVSSTLRNSSPASYLEGLDDTFGNNYVNNVHNLEEKAPDTKHKEELPHMPVTETKKWYIVVDVGCFLTEESRKSLQLLEGIRGTQLIIPRIVIRELDHLKRCQGILSRGTKASSVLQWIEESMMRTSWWIHVQSSSETFPAAPTPPATPRSLLCDGSLGFGTATSPNFTGFSTCGSLMEIVSPTAEDHILDCALLFKRIKDDGQLMLLTSSTTLRIKAMAEGLLCETPKEFRESLVNPFSKRFLWADSSPRGSTWSCLEEVGIAENYHQQFASAGMPKAEGTVKGLKLILLHTSHCGMSNSIS
ncbi:hypothetical protein M5K25_020718 [Dendrobium thyrsiflorum]|uniref:FHA domain-containing protein n=1 Tax=Dendrobium thyrsiflorum TaxID=117978 RepID=A0ABD0UAQ2_DENTH